MLVDIGCDGGGGGGGVTLLVLWMRGVKVGAILMEIITGSLLHGMAQFVVSPACLQACICMLELMTTISSDL